MYGPDLAYIHHHGFGAFARNAAPGVLDFFRKAGIADGTVVDLGCGSGIWLRELDRAGYTTVGVEQSPALLALARDVAPEAVLHQGSVYDFDFPKCDAVTALGEVLSYLPDGAESLPWASLFDWLRAAWRSSPAGSRDPNETEKLLL